VGLPLKEAATILFLSLMSLVTLSTSPLQRVELPLKEVAITLFPILLSLAVHLKSLYQNPQTLLMVVATIPLLGQMIFLAKTLILYQDQQSFLVVRMVQTLSLAIPQVHHLTSLLLRLQVIRGCLALFLELQIFQDELVENVF
jgi:hypothetical protein